MGNPHICSCSLFGFDNWGARFETGVPLHGEMICCLILISVRSEEQISITNFSGVLSVAGLLHT